MFIISETSKEVVPAPNYQEYVQQYMESFAKQSGRIVTNYLETSKKESFSLFKLKDVAKWLENPQKNESQIRNLSRYLYNVSPQYKRVVDYFATMLNYQFVPKPILENFMAENPKKIQKQLFEISALVEKMNLPHEFEKIARTLVVEDVFFGYEHETPDSYSIQHLNPNYCRIAGTSDGAFYFEFDFGFFTGNKEAIDYYPDEFIQKFNLFKENPKLRWQEISPTKSICLKLNEHLSYSYPIFSTIFESVFEIDEYKQLKKDRAKLDNYMILIQKIPYDDKSGDMNKFLLDPEMASGFHNAINSQLPDEIALATTPMDIEGIKLEKSTNDQDKVAEAIGRLYDAAGTSQFLFNSDKMTSIGLSKSITTDEQILFALLRQEERWLNRKFKSRFKKVMYSARLLDSTSQNAEELRKSLIELGTVGVPVHFELGAILGYTPLSLMNKAHLEHKVLKLSDLFIPLASSHTANGEQANGRPKSSDSKISESGEANRQNDTNAPD